MPMKRPPPGKRWTVDAAWLDAYDKALLDEWTPVIAARSSVDPARRMGPSEVAALLAHPDVAPVFGRMVAETTAKALEAAVPHYARQIAADVFRQHGEHVARATIEGVVAPATKAILKHAAPAIAQSGYEQGRRDERQSAAFATTTIDADHLKDAGSVVVIRRKKP